MCVRVCVCAMCVCACVCVCAVRHSFISPLPPPPCPPSHTPPQKRVRGPGQQATLLHVVGRIAGHRPQRRGHVWRLLAPACVCLCMSVCVCAHACISVNTCPEDMRPSKADNLSRNTHTRAQVVYALQQSRWFKQRGGQASMHTRTSEGDHMGRNTHTHTHEH